MTTDSDSVAPAGRPRRAKDRFTFVVYSILAAVGMIELFAGFWLDLF